METAVISEQLKELLADKVVQASVFTTFSFDPEFFELEVVPLLLPDNIPYSSEPRVKSFQVREALRESNIQVDVFYDLQLYRKEGQGSPAMEYGCHGVYRDRNAFHAKVILILAYDEIHEVDCLLVGAGSNNLSQSGWWDNIECQHWESIYSGEVSRRFVNRLREDVQYLRTVSQPVGDSTALDLIDAFLTPCRSSHDYESAAYYNIDYINTGRNFPTFLKRNAKRLWRYSNWTLEIISPYFAEKTDNMEHRSFFSLGVDQIHLLLPQNQQGEAVVHPEYYRHIENEDEIHWATWQNDTAGRLGIAGAGYRRLHAKIYHFYNKKQSWIFVGSVNFSLQAMTMNVEAGFLVKLPKPTRLLQLLDADTANFEFAEPEEDPADIGDDDLQIPPIMLRYDWKSKCLSGAVANVASLEVVILNAENEPVIEPWYLKNKTSEYSADVVQLEQLLGNGSLVKIEAKAISGDRYPAHRVMLQQTGWSHKKLVLPDLTAEQILAIYAGMSPERRQLLLMNAQIRKLVLAGQAGEMTMDDGSDQDHHFFSEYAETFHAFRQLKSKLLESADAGYFTQVDYYLTGTGVDSLPSLLTSADDEENPLNAVTSYLVLLCAKGIFEHKIFRRRDLVSEELSEVLCKLTALKKSDRLVLEDNSPAKRKRFFNWFETQFEKDYRAKLGT